MMSKLIILVFSLFSILSACSGQIEQQGPCYPNIPVVQNFNVQNYLGTWYEIARYPQRPQVGQCTRAEYGDLGGGLVSVANSQVINRNLATLRGEARAVGTDGSGLLNVTFVLGPDDILVANYYVLATDYTNYAFVYSCENLRNGNRQVGSWKLSRTKTLSPQALAIINNVIQETQGLGLNQDYYQPTSHSNESCFYYPRETGAHVILPGQCDENIPVVQSIKVDEFTGTWYQITRYDAVDGSTCVGARLTFNAPSNTFNVTSWEVVDGKLLTTEGSARFNSNDGSGKFSIVMPVTGSGTKETIIYILGTDYANYALAYSCENTNSTHRQVGAWQLSRQRTLSANSMILISYIVQERLELHNPYFKRIPHYFNCPDPSSTDSSNSAFLFKSSIIVIFVCALLQLIW